MCGIAGVLSTTADARVGTLARAATRALAHRGPDGERFFRAGGGAFGLAAAEDLDAPATLVAGHRRLSIVDVAGGAQPMANEDETVWVAFNGEIYNHQELRAELERSGHRFRTRSDTEVLVHGWEEWQQDLFCRLNGIFALAIFDASADDVVLVRDPVGVKPLYVGAADRLAWWSSELAAATEAGLVPPAVSPDALKLFLTFRFIPSPYTVYDGAWKVPPGHWLRLRELLETGQPSFRRYVTRIRSTAEPRTRTEWREAISVELDEAVGRQLMADVPVASLLSGGVDSSLVTHIMARRLPYAPHTFGIGFASDGAMNEALTAERAAADLHVPHTSVVVRDGDYIAAWPRAIEQVGEPIANSGGLLVRMLCDAVRPTHKVVLTGQGADEPLGGYPRHVVERLRPAARFVPRLTSRVVGAVRGADEAARLARALAAPTTLDRYVEMLCVVPPEQVDGLVGGTSISARELARNAVSRWLEDARSDDSLNEFLRVDARMSLADDLLLIADHFSMRASVELRVPFLDLRFLELVERMPSCYKVSRLGARKWLYRQAAAAALPNAVARRACGPTARFGRKRGFSTPLAAWFESEGGPLANPAQWTASLRTLPGVTLGDGGNALLDARFDTFSRQRAAFYSLATWARAAA